MVASKTLILVTMSDGHEVRVNSPESVEGLITIMGDGQDLGTFIGFKDVDRSMRLIYVHGISTIDFIPEEG